MSKVTIANVSKTYPGHGAKDAPLLALSDVSFTVEDNEFCAILGHSGCGKTTLLTMVAGFETPSKGQVLVGDRVAGPPSWERSVIFQDYALFPWLTVRGNVAFGLEMKHVPREQRDSIVQRHIARVGLAGFEDRYPHQLSGGMRQRVSIARALAVDPLVLLMDEPFAALDAQTRGSMQREMVRIWAEDRKTVILVTHSIEEAIILADRIVVMSRRPGTVKADLRVDLPRPRREDDPRFLALKREIRELIHDEYETDD